MSRDHCRDDEKYQADLAEYLRRSYHAVDGLWFVMVEEELGFDRALDLAAGGDFAVRMRGLYHYLDRRLMESNLRKQSDGIREVRDRLSVIRDAWREMLEQQTSPRDQSADILEYAAH